jgi:exopolysaccharide biosynthesis predicted pyruvyltransferase EpsI
MMDERNNTDWFKDYNNEEIEKANMKLMRDSCLLIGGKTHGALISTIFRIPPIHMNNGCKNDSISKFWLKYSNSFTRKFVAKELKNLQNIVFCRKRLHGGYRVIKF